MFETGTPHTGPEVRLALEQLVGEGVEYMASFSDETFFRPQGAAWSPAGHIRHLRRASSPLVVAFRLPRLLLGFRFGWRRIPSVSFAQLRDRYQAALAQGGQAGAFSPGPEPPPPDPAARRQEILSRWEAVTRNLAARATPWSEPALDRYQLPHPLLGALSLREMLCFTVYHTAHHLRRVAERAGGTP